MKKTYLKLQIKRTFSIYPAIFLVTISMILAIGIAAMALLNANTQSENKQKVRVGVVGELEDSYFGVGMYALQNLDSSRFYVEFCPMQEEEAVKALKNREINGYIDIPDNFVDGIYSGQNYAATYVTLNTPDGFGSILTAEITEVVSDIVTETQAGIYSMQRIAADHGKTEEIYDQMNDLNLRYIKLVFDRNNIYGLKTLGISDNLSMGGYYTCSLILIFMMIWGISCNKLLGRRNLSLARSLNAFGLKPASQLFCEYAGFLAVTIITFLILAISAGAVISQNSFMIRELSDASISGAVFFLIQMLPVIIMITTMQMAIYEMVSGTVSVVLLQFFLTVGLGYLSGCFYPNTFFPDSVQSVAAALPSGVGFTYLKRLMAENLQMTDLIAVVFYTLFFAVVAFLARRRRIAGEHT